MNLPKPLQVELLGKIMDKYGVDRSKMDLEALVDSTLTYDENLKSIRPYINLLAPLDKRIAADEVSKWRRRIKLRMYASKYYWKNREVVLGKKKSYYIRKKLHRSLPLTAIPKHQYTPRNGC